MQELSVKQLLNRYNFIVPEIQREFVWGQYYDKADSVINNFFSDLSKQFYAAINNSKSVLPINDNLDYWSITQEIIAEYNKQEPLNIGFLYSYLPNYHLENQIRHDVYLIDGQQRFTTLFIMLFFYALKENKKDDFITLFRFEYDFEKIAFDYRVRALTHNFILELVQKCNKFSDIDDLENKTWFLKDFKKDVTINSILGTIKLLKKDYSQIPTGFFNYLSNKVKFWHFKTETTSQGEELYITMNSRGQALVDYENKKAKLFENRTNQDKSKFGKKWEVWQDFFWKYKGENENADNGFNEFLKWIYEIENIKSIDNVVTLEIIETYFKSFLYVVENKNLLNYQNCKFPVYKDFISQFESKKNEPLLSAKNKVVLYPVLLYLNNSKDSIVSFTEQYKYEINNSIELTQIHSFCRFFFNISRNSEAYKEAIKLLSISNLCFNQDITELIKYKENNKEFRNILSDEELLKLTLFANADEKKRNELENVFWVAEDHNIIFGRLKNLLIISQNTNSLNNIDTNSFDIKKFIDLFSIIENRMNTEEFIYAVLASKSNFEVFAEGWSWGLRRYNLGDKPEKKRQYYRNDLYNQVLNDLFISKLTLDEVIQKQLDNTTDEILKRIKQKIVKESSKYWQWKEHKRFFFDNTKIYFPNGIQAKSNTGELTI